MRTLMYLQLGDSGVIRRLHSDWLIIAGEIVNAPNWPETKLRMQHGKAHLLNIEQRVREWFFGI